MVHITITIIILKNKPTHHKNMNKIIYCMKITPTPPPNRNNRKKNSCQSPFTITTLSKIDSVQFHLKTYILFILNILKIKGPALNIMYRGFTLCVNCFSIDVLARVEFSTYFYILKKYLLKNKIDCYNFPSSMIIILYPKCHGPVFYLFIFCFCYFLVD